MVKLSALKVEEVGLHSSLRVKAVEGRSASKQVRLVKAHVGFCVNVSFGILVNWCKPMHWSFKRPNSKIQANAGREASKIKKNARTIWC